MGLILVHLSDIHLSINKHNNPILERTDALCGAIRSALNPGDHCVIIITGDIADWGKPKEYELIEIFIKKVYDEISNQIHAPLHFVKVPGNHDLDFDVEDPSYDEKIRQTIIGSISPKNPPNEMMIKLLLAPQAPYREYIQRLGDSIQMTACTGLMETKSLEFGPLNVRFHLLNTAYLSLKKEMQGTTWANTGDLKRQLDAGDPPGTVTIGLLHHPYSWLHSENVVETKRLLESNCDILFTGHEHSADLYGKSRRTTEQNLYIEGGVLQDHDDDNNSSFNIVQLVPERQAFLCKTFRWNGNYYEEITEPYEHRYLRLRQPIMNQFEVQEEWAQWLGQLGTDFRHPRCKDLKLEDLFVYPDMQRLDVKKACTPAGMVRDQNVVGFLQEKRRVLIAGAEKVGKTCLAKKLFTDMREAGYVPLLLHSDFDLDKMKDKTLSERIRLSLDRVVNATYTAESAIKFWQTRIEERTLIIDDYNKFLSIGGRDELLQWADEHFRIVILISAPGIRMTEILNRGENDTLLWTYEHIDILESDSESRHNLIQKWLRAGADPYIASADERYRDAVRFEQIIDSVSGNGVIPSLPMFVQMMMQQIETRGTTDLTNGLYGSLYEIIIRDVIRGAASSPADIEVKLNYLSEFAGMLYSKKVHFIDESSFFHWNDWYCDEFNRRLNGEKMLLQFESIGVFKRKGDGIGFKYRYYFCFFHARYLARRIHEEESMKTVEFLCTLLYNEDAANTMLFLCHLSQHPRILELVLNTVRGHFTKIAEYDITMNPSVIPAGMAAPGQLKLSSSSPEEARLIDLRRRDDVERPHGLNEESEDEIDVKYHEIIDLVNEINSAHHTTRICGQLIRNFYGNMRGAEQIELIQESYGLCLRTMTVLYQFLEKDKEEIAAYILGMLKHRYPELEPGELDVRVKRSLYTISLAICYGLIKHTANSLVLADLKPSFDKILEIKGIPVSHRMLDLATRLDFFEAFPEKLVLDLARDLDGGIIGREVLRVLTWDHFKQFRHDFRVRQKVCEALGIEFNQPAMLTGKDRKLL